MKTTILEQLSMKAKNSDIRIYNVDDFTIFVLPLQTTKYGRAHPIVCTEDGINFSFNYETPTMDLLYTDYKEYKFDELIEQILKSKSMLETNAQPLLDFIKL